MFGLDNNRKRHPREWLPVTAQIMRDANERVGRGAAMGAYERRSAVADHDQALEDYGAIERRVANLSIKVGPGATGGIAPAYYDQQRRELVLDSDVALPGVDPATVRWGQSRWRSRHLRAAGLVEHEVGHAAHSDSRWFGEWRKAGADVCDFGSMIEETRMESRTIAEDGDWQALAAVAHELILRDHSEPTGDPWADAMNGLLILGRDQRHGGSLQTSAVDPFRDGYAEIHGRGWVDTLDRLIGDYNRTYDDQVPRGEAMRPLMESWREQLGAASESDGGGGQGDGDGQPAAGDPGAQSMREQLLAGADVTEQELRAQAEAQAEAEAERDAAQVEQITHGHDTSDQRGIVITKRGVTPSDARLRSEIVRHFTRLALPEVAKSTHRQQLPPGRMIGRGAVQRQAQIAGGMVADADLFRSQRRKVTTTPPPVIGVMTDCSGSMRHAQPGVATLAWALSEAGRAIQARTALVAFGAQAQLVEHDPIKVSEAAATHGWENFRDGFCKLDQRLHLTAPYRGARVLIIASDGGYNGVEGDAAARTVRHLERRGVAVVWAAIGCGWNGHERNIDAGTVLEISGYAEPADVARRLIAAIEQAMRAAQIAL